MTTAEHIRWYAIKHHIAPARAAGREEVRIRLGDIRQKMGLTNPLQSVRSALGTKLFQDEAGVELLAPIGPRAGANTYGNLPRLILAWLCTEAVRTQNRVLVLGKSLSDFMRELDIYAGGGNAHTKLRNQMKRLFGCTVSLIYEDKNGQATVNALIARRRERAEFVMRVRLQSAA